MGKPLCKLAATVVAFTIFALPANLSARERRGAQVVVLLRGGGSVSGELIAVRESSIIVLDHVEADRSVDVTDISQIRLQKRRRGVGPAGIMGVVIGAACGITYALVQSDGYGDFVMPGALSCGLLGGLLGGAIGFGVAGAGGEYKEQVINFAPMTDPQIRLSLARLRSQARIAR